MINKVMSIVFAIVLILFILIVLNGLSFGKIEMYSVEQLMEKNKNLEVKVENIGKLTSTDYPSKVNTMEETFSKLKIQKQKYEDMTDIQGTTEQTHEVKQYDVEYLWKTIGKRSTSRNIGINMSIEKGSSTGLYNLKFTVSGTYTDILQFITDLENDSDLEFRIYNFSMSATSNGSAVLKSSSATETKQTETSESKTEENNNSSDTQQNEGSQTDKKEENKTTTSDTKTNITTSSSSSENIYSTFTVKNIKINPSSIKVE